MSAVGLDPELEALLRPDAPRHAGPLAGRERVAEWGFAVALVAAAVAIALLFPDRPNAGPSALMVSLVGAYALLRRVEFTIGAGITGVVQLVLAPMLLLVDPAFVPLLVAAGNALARLPEYARGESHPERLVLHLGDAWYAVGPAVLIAAFLGADPGFDQWPLFVAVLAAQFACDLATSVVREFLAFGARPALQLRLFGLVVAVDAALAPIGFMTALVAAHHPAVLLLPLPLVCLIDVLRRERERGIEHALALSAAYRGTALLMGDVLEADDEYTGGEHSQGVVKLALEAGRELRLDPRAQRDLEFGALLHDIGKLRTPDEILQKPGKLTDEEWEIMRRHPEDGQRMLERVGGVLAEVGVIVRGHHERWDGNGYPDRLAGTDIPMAARIICVCDSFNAMTTDRPYRGAMPVAEAVAELRRCSGTQFDPDVVEAVCTVIERELRPGVPLALVA